MTMPTVVNTATANGNSASVTVGVPSGLQAGDLLVAFQHIKTSLGTMDSKWTQVPNASGGDGIHQLRAMYAIADGSESGTLTLATSASGDWTAIVLAIRDHHALFTPNGTAPVMVTATTVNPPALTSGFGNADTLWLVAAGCGNPLSVPYTVPTNYGNQVSDERGNIATGVCRRTLAAASEDPGVVTWGDGASRAGIALTVAVKGAATRIYALSASSDTPAVDASWEAGPAVRRVATDERRTSASITGTQVNATGVANQDYAVGQWISGPVAAQTIGGASVMLRGQMLAREGQAAVDARAQLLIRVLSNDLSTVRGTIIGHDTGALSSEFSVSGTAQYTNRMFPRGGPVATTAVSAQAGDRIVIEYGFRNHGTSGSTVQIPYAGDPAEGDLPEDEAATLYENAGPYPLAWFEIGQDIKWLRTAGDTGGGTDTVNAVGRIITASDTGGGTDTRTAFTATHGRSDTGTGTEAIGNRTMVRADSGVGTDASEVEILVVAIDTRPLPATLEEVLRTHHTPIARLLFLAGDLETVLHTIDATRDGDNQWMLSGNVVTDRRRNVFRSGEVAVVNRDGLYDPVNSSSLVWPNRIVRLERGAMIGGVPQYRPLMTGLVDDWDVAEDSGVVSFNVWSRMHQADQQFPEAVTYPAGMGVDDVIRAMAERAGMGTTDEWYDLDAGGLTLSEARTYDTDDNILDGMVRLAFDNGLDLYDNGSGQLVLRPFVDPDAEVPEWEFVRGADATMTELRRTGKATSVYNRAVAVGIGADLYPIRAEARVLNPNDPLYNPADGSGPLGDRPRPTYTTSDATGQQALNDLAFRLLVEGALFEESLVAAAIPIPFLMARDVVRFTGAGVDAKYLLDMVNIPIGPGTMRMSTRRVRTLLADG